MIEKLLLFVPFLVVLAPMAFADQSNPYLYVSAENSDYDNHFAGSMVVEVIVMDPQISDTSVGKGEPNVSLNGQDLRMVQATDGSWYAYFANREKAQAADEIASSGVAGQGLDFGQFCSSQTDSSVLGISFSDSNGVAVPRTGLDSATDGQLSLEPCTGTLDSGSSINNVVRNSKSINTNTGSGGQVGLDSNAWPLIQLFSFSNTVEIQYSRAGGDQIVVLQYDEIPNISLDFDRESYPSNAQVILTLNDVQLNQDPTDEDSWTFNIDAPVSTFYNAFDENGRDAANGGPGLINLIPYLSGLGFEDNGILTMDLNSIIRLQSNNHQPVTSVSNGADTFGQIVTLVESGPNSGKFVSYGSSNESVLGIERDAPRNQAGIVEYNDRETSVISGSSSASISLDGDTRIVPGKRTLIQITDSDQNIDSKRRDSLDVYRSSAIIPSFELGSPVTLESASSVRFYSSSDGNLAQDGTLVSSSVPDSNSDRLLIDSARVSFSGKFEMISIDLGVTASRLQDLFVDVSNSGSLGTNWINFDLRSLQQQLDLSSFSQTRMALHFGLDDTSPIQILDPGNISTGQGLIRIDDADIASLGSKSGAAFLVIDFDSSNSGAGGTMLQETDAQPIVIDFFSFGINGDEETNNAIYRLELEETAANSGVFEGTLEYSVTNQINFNDPALIESLRTIDENVKFLVTNRLLDEDGVNIAYSDLTPRGSTEQKSVKSDILTHSGTISFDSSSYRFGRPVTVQLVDPDLNLDPNRVDIYNVIDNPASKFVDTVGNGAGEWLLEITIKGVRYQRCVIDGAEHGGLGASNFALVETSRNSGIFEGSFKMPSQICNAAGTRLISPAGGSIDAKYNDFLDGQGNPNIFETGRSSNPSKASSALKLNSHQFLVPQPGQIQEVVLDGSIKNHKRGIPVEITIVEPDGQEQMLGLQVTGQGNFRMVSTLSSDSKQGSWTIHVDYDGNRVGTLLFDLVGDTIPPWIKNSAGWWSSGTVSEDEFLDGIEYLIREDVIKVQTGSDGGSQMRSAPEWFKNITKWWSTDSISDEEFVAALEFLVKKGIIQI